MARNKHDELWDEHLLGCNACNYDEQCMACEVGEPYTEHACNCKHGPETNGYHLWQKTTYGQRQIRNRQMFELDKQRSDLLRTIEPQMEKLAHKDPDWFQTSLRELFSDILLDLLKDPDMRAAIGELIEVELKLNKLQAESNKLKRRSDPF